jgi:hypothetical protein
MFKCIVPALLVAAVIVRQRYEESSCLLFRR